MAISAEVLALLANLHRMRQAVNLVCPNDGVGPLIHDTVAGPGNVRVDYRPEATQPQKDAAVAVVAAFDWSAGAHTVYENLKGRTEAKTQIANGNGLGKLFRNLLGILMDAFNVLRAQVVGEGTVVWDVPNMANATGATSPNITVAGAAFGDYVDVAASISFAGLVAFGSVSAPNTVVIRLHNGTGSAVNPTSGTYRVLVRRQGVLTQYQLSQLRTALDNRIDVGTED